MDARQQTDVRFEHDGRVDVGAGRVDHRDPVEHPATVDAAPQHLFRVGKLQAVVHAERDRRVVGRNRDHLVPRRAQHFDRVGQVVLTLRVLRAQAPQRGREQVAPEAVDRRVDLRDLALLDVSIGVLDDARDPIVFVADHAAVTSRVGHVGGQHGCRRLLQPVLRSEQCDRLRAQQRMVAGEHEDVVLRIEIIEDARGERDAHRIAGAALHALLDELHRYLGDELFLERADDTLGAVADDDHDPFEPRELGERVDDVEHHRAPAQLVQDLRCSGSDACAFAGGKHDGGERAVGHRWLSASRSASGCGRWLGGKVSNLLLGLQRPLCCRYTTPDCRQRYPSRPIVMGELTRRANRRLTTMG
jgi:hypothetical protein